MPSSFKKKNKSFREMLKNKGPRTDHSGTPNTESFE